MTAPGPRRPDDRGDPDLSPFATAEKLAAQWEAQHSRPTPGRRTAPLGLSEYLAHERCTEATSAAGHPHHRPHRDDAEKPSTGGGRPRPGARRAAAPVDAKPHLSDLWGWLSGGGRGGGGSGSGRA
jgi:hypothetical protein